MNEKKICFISCVNNERLYKENLLYINNLNIPEGYEIETIAIRDAKSMTSGYNKAIEMTDAKYKVYTHQDVVISNKNFVSDMVKIFNRNERLGLLGAIGAKQLPINANWWESPSTFGKVYENHTGEMVLLKFADVIGDYEAVQALDGLLLITQYDIKWREDLFKGFHFYDISQCMEFIQAGFEVGVAKQEIPWAVHDCGLKLDKGDFLVYEGYRAKFLKEYARQVCPLVSILIPAYNQTKYLKSALDSAIDQTYPNTEIIICDDSTTDDVKFLVAEYMDKTDKIRYYNNGGPLGGKGKLNIRKCFNLANGEYISYLLHDDEYYPKKIEKMVEKLLSNKLLTLVASKRTLIDKDGNHMVYRKGFSIDQEGIMFGDVTSRIMLFTIGNIIGELTTILFRKKDIEDDYNLINYYENEIKCLGDISLFLRLLSKGHMYYFQEHLSKFRLHYEQNTYDKEIGIWACIDFFNIITTSYERGIFIYSECELGEILRAWSVKYKVQIEQVENFKFSEEDDLNIKKYKVRLMRYSKYFNK